MQLFFVLLLLLFYKDSLAQSECGFQSYRYNLSWSLDNNRNVNYNLTYFNFPTNDNYWIAFGYSQPINNLIVFDSINDQIEIGTANIVNNQPRKTVNSNILARQSAFLSGGNLHAQFSIPLDALRLSSNDGSNCLQWQFYNNATRNGTAYNGMPETQRICNIESCGVQPSSDLLFNDHGNQRDPNSYFDYLKSLYRQQLQQQNDDQYQRQAYGNNNNNNQYQYQASQYGNNQNIQYGNQYDQSSRQYQNAGYQNANYNPQTTSNTYPVQGCNNCNQQSQPQTTGCSTCNNQPQTTSGCNNCNQQPNSGCTSCNQQQQQTVQYQQPQTSNCNTCNQQSQGIQQYQNGYSQGGGSNQYGNTQQYNPQFQSSPYGTDPGLGPVYDSPQTNLNSDFVVENPNYIFLNPALTQEFRDSVNRPNQNGLFRDQSGNFISTTTQAPVLSNDQQNQQNFQRIQSNPPTTVAPSLYTNNIYGYDYRSNQNQPFTVNGNNQQYQPPPYRRFEAPQNSPFKRRKRQATSGSLTGTAYEGQDRPFMRTNTFFDSPVQRNPSSQTVYRNPYNTQNSNYNSNTNTNTNYNNNNFNNNNQNYNNQNYNNQNNNYQAIQRDQQPNNGASIYWPYRQQVVSADDVINPNSSNYTQVFRQNDAARYAFQDPNCASPDPYWCQDYVNNFMLWQNQYDGQSQFSQPSQASCQALSASLQNSANRCCQNVRQIGCNA